jgi:hypothetical protein
MYSREKRRKSLPTGLKVVVVHDNTNNEEIAVQVGNSDDIWEYWVQYCMEHFDGVETRDDAESMIEAELSFTWDMSVEWVKKRGL